MQEELCEKIVEVRRRSDRVMVMVMVLAFEEESAYAPQRGRTDTEKDAFYDEMASERDLHRKNEMALGFEDLSGHVGKYADGFEGVHGGNGIGEKNVEGRQLLEFCDKRELCVTDTWFNKKEKRKVTFSAGGNETEIDFVLVSKENRKYLRCESHSVGTATQVGGC